MATLLLIRKNTTNNISFHLRRLNWKALRMIQVSFYSNFHCLVLNLKTVLGGYQHGWLIKTSSKSFAVYAATSIEKGEWMAHINKCIDDLLRKSIHSSLH